jgi:AraC-like DNA-binding protein
MEEILNPSERIEDPKQFVIINDMMIDSKMDDFILSFKRFFPQKRLEKYIDYYWISKSNSPINHSAKIIQDGSIYILFLFDAEYNIKMNNGNFTNISKAHIIGGKKINTYFAEKGFINVLGIKFKPGGFYPFLQIPAKEFSDSFFNLEDLFGNIIIEIEEKLYENENPLDKIKITESFLLNRISSNINEPSLQGLNISNILKFNDVDSINRLCTYTGFSYKKIERIFLREIGFTPKYLNRIFRFHRVLQNIHNNNFKSLSELAYNNSYFDQSHFIKEFEYFTGLTPQEFLNYHINKRSLM